MKILQITLGIIAFLILVTQTIRQGYLIWLHPRGSVLDKYEQPLRDNISKAQSLDDLLRMYDEAHKNVEGAKADKSTPAVPPSEKYETEPYKSERTLADAIRSWEAKAREIRELRFYWACGVLLLVMGVMCYRKLNRWLGLTFLIAGFCQLIYRTSPTFFGADTTEFDRLLAHKFAFSLGSLLLLAFVVRSGGVFADSRED